MKTLLLTYFEPFEGRPRNRSEDVARAVAARPELARHFERIELCRIPVVYDVARAVALDCIRTHQALGRDLWVASLGEWSGTELRIETQAHNRDHSPTTADNAGTLRTGQPIVSHPRAANTLAFSFPMDALLAAPQLQELKPSVSTDPGGFLCNHLAYGLTFELSRENTPFVFIHVGRDSRHELEQEASAIAEALALAANHEATTR